MKQTLCLTGIAAIIAHLLGCAPTVPRSSQYRGSPAATTTALPADGSEDSEDSDAEPIVKEKAKQNKPKPAESDPLEKKPAVSCAGLSIVNGTLVSAAGLVARSTIRIMDISTDDTICTGTLVGPNHIITAGHCVALDSVVKLEQINIGFGIKGAASPGIKVTGITYNPGWQKIIDAIKANRLTPEYGANDISVITFTGSLPAGAMPAKLMNTQSIKVGDALTVAGFGQRSDNDRVDHKTLSMVEIRVGVVVPEAKEFRSAATNKGDCYGDSGGPFYTRNPDTQCFDLAGVVSRGVSASCATGEGIHTDAHAHVEWIKEAFVKLGQPWEP